LVEAAVDTRACCSQRLIGAALAGLLCLATASCSSKTEPPAAGSTSSPPAEITSSTIVADMTMEDFSARCDARAGSVEVMPHCGGFATAKGFSYDATTQELSEHTCMGANTCAGWNCAIVD
jgi:hypothetical protein